MILAEFQSLYPTGCLISELVQIYHGKYIVRVSVQIDGVTRTTGMAAAETIEIAEDKARDRALMILATTNVVQSVQAATPPQPTLTAQVKALQSEPTSSYSLNLPPVEAIAPTPALEIITDNYHQDFEQSKALQAKPEPYLEAPAENLGLKSSEQLTTQLFPELGSSNVTPFPQRSPRSSSNPKQDVENQPTTTKKKKKSEPVDLSDVIAKTDVEIERLGWTKEQGREFLKSRYGKLGRTLLSEDELLDFLKYLESQPTPVDPLAGF